MGTKTNNYDMNRVFDEVRYYSVGIVGIDEADVSEVLRDEDTAVVTVEFGDAATAARDASLVLRYFMLCVPEVQVSLTTHGNDIEFTFTRSLYVKEDN